MAYVLHLLKCKGLCIYFLKKKEIDFLSQLQTHDRTIQRERETIMIKLHIDAKAQGESYKPTWKKLVTAGRAREGLFAEWREQLAQVQKEIGFEYIRFHGIFNDDMMVYKEDKDGVITYNWKYVDSLFDFLLSIGLRPFLELGFMPHDLSSGEQTIFWWKGNVTPPADHKKWADLVEALLRHCINRYGLSEVLNWYFEVWNEANITPFWSGTQADYFKLYEVTARAVKRVHSDLRVGGPATSSSDTDECPWIAEFLAFCEKKDLPVDFVSTHPYPNSYPLYSYGLPCYKDENGTRRSLEWLKETMSKTKYRDVEVHLTEWNSSPNCFDLVHDTAFMAPFVIQNNLRAVGMVDSIGFWTFTDIFEEEALGRTIFSGGFGMLNTQGLLKPSYHGYWFLSRLGDRILAQGDNYVVTRKDDRVQVLLWNYCHYNETYANGHPEIINEHDRYGAFLEKDNTQFELNLENTSGKYRITKYIFDRENGSVYDSWLKNGAPAHPDAEELSILKANMRPTGSISYRETDGAESIVLSIKPHGVAFFEFTPVY